MQNIIRVNKALRLEEPGIKLDREHMNVSWLAEVQPHLNADGGRFKGSGR